jgi:hypothetical protein
MANTPENKKPGPTTTPAKENAAATEASKHAASFPHFKPHPGATPLQSPFGMNVPPYPQNLPPPPMAGMNPLLPPMMSPGAMAAPMTSAGLFTSLGTMLKLGIDTINTVLASGNQLLQGISGSGYYPGYPSAPYHPGAGCHDHGGHPQHHCQHEHYHDSHGHSCCDICGDNCCHPSVHNCC